MGNELTLEAGQHWKSNKHPGYTIIKVDGRHVTYELWCGRQDTITMSSLIERIRFNKLELQAVEEPA